MVMIVCVSVVSLASTAHAGNAPPRLYTLAATEACLEGLPDVVAGLPPATPPTSPALFVYRGSPSHVPPPAYGHLGAWYGSRRRGSYEEVSLSFFKSTQAARRSVQAAERVNRNVVAWWDPPSVSEAGWGKSVLGCLRAVAPAAAVPAPKRSIPAASLATFAGYWGGHTRGLRITSDGRGHERENSGCCVRMYQMTLRIVSVRGTLTRATATYRVTSFRRYDRGAPRIRTGQIGMLRLRNGIVANTLTKDYFCSDPAWGATGACGA